MDFKIIESIPYHRVIITVVLLLIYLISRFVTRRIVRKRALKNRFEESRTIYVVRFFHTINFLVVLIFILITWDINFQVLRQYFLGFLTVVGVAVFASWSILSNLTAAVILFFYYTYKVGSIIRIVDGNNSVTGRIIEVTLFYIKLETRNKNMVSYPNNQAIQKPIIELRDWDSEDPMPGNP